MSTPTVDFFQRAKLLTIVNRNNTFYLESAAGNSRWQSITVPEEAKPQSMYLVVRSLKHDNEKTEYDI